MSTSANENLQRRLRDLQEALPLFAEHCQPINLDKAARELNIAAQFQVITKNWQLLGELFLEIAASGLVSESRKGFQMPGTREELSVSIASIAWAGKKPVSGVKLIIWGNNDEPSAPSPSVSSPSWGES